MPTHFLEISSLKLLKLTFFKSKVDQLSLVDFFRRICNKCLTFVSPEPMKFRSTTTSPIFLGSTEHTHRSETFTFFPGLNENSNRNEKQISVFDFLLRNRTWRKNFPFFLKGCLFHFSSPGLVGWLRLLWTAAADDSNCHLQNSLTLSLSLSLSGSCTLTLSFTNVTVPYRFPTYSKEGVPMRHNVYVCERVCVRVREIERVRERVCASTYLLERACVCVRES